MSKLMSLSNQEIYSMLESFTMDKLLLGEKLESPISEEDVAKKNKELDGIAMVPSKAGGSISVIPLDDYATWRFATNHSTFALNILDNKGKNPYFYTILMAIARVLYETGNHLTIYNYVTPSRLIDYFRIISHDRLSKIFVSTGKKRSDKELSEYCLDNLEVFVDTPGSIRKRLIDLNVCIERIRNTLTYKDLVKRPEIVLDMANRANYSYKQKSKVGWLKEPSQPTAMELAMAKALE